eukprot:CFRG8398T1
MSMFLLRLSVLVLMVVGMIASAEFLANWFELPVSFVDQAQRTISKWGSELGAKEKWDFVTKRITEDYNSLDIPSYTNVTLPSIPSLFESLPQFKWPQFELPQFELPQFELPQFELPQFELPQFELPQFELPQFELPQFELPQWDQFVFETPKFSLPNIPNMFDIGCEGLDLENFDATRPIVYHYAFLAFCICVHLGLYCTGSLTAWTTLLSFASGEALFACVLMSEGQTYQPVIDVITPSTAVLTILYTVILSSAAFLPPMHPFSALGIVCAMAMYPAVEEHILPALEQIFPNWEIPALAIVCSISYAIVLQSLLRRARLQKDVNIHHNDEKNTQSQLKDIYSSRSTRTRSSSRVPTREPTPAISGDIDFDEALQKVYARHFHDTYE